MFLVWDYIGAHVFGSILSRLKFMVCQIMTLAWEINVPFLLLLFHMRVCISTFVNVVVLYRIRSGQSQNGIYDTRDRDKPYKDSAQL